MYPLASLKCTAVSWALFVARDWDMLPKIQHSSSKSVDHENSSQLHKGLTCFIIAKEHTWYYIDFFCSLKLPGTFENAYYDIGRFLSIKMTFGQTWKALFSNTVPNQ